MNEIVAKSWSHIQDVLFSRDDLWNESLRRFRSPMAYRGLDRANHTLVTSLYRLGGDFASLEGHLLRNFKKYAHRDLVEHDTDWHWLSVAQHHGLPTRLLDWTYSPYVALHFATAKLEHYGQEGAVWAVNFEKAKRALPDEMRKWLDTTGANGFSVDTLAELKISPLDLEAHEQRGMFAMFFEPPSIDDRIVNQYALFSVLSQSRSTFDYWLSENKDLWWKLIVPATLKWEIRDKLDQANITERVLFPGLAGVSAWLKRHYSPGPGSS
jgi:hypothetical protein